MTIKKSTYFSRIVASTVVLVIPALLIMILISGVRAQEQCKTALAAAEKEYKLRQFNEAIRLIAPCLQNSAGTAKDKAAAFKLLARIHFALGALDNAEIAIRRMLKLEPDWKPDAKLDTPSFREFAEKIIAPDKGESRGVRPVPTPEPPSDTTQYQQQNYALVVGINKYSSSRWSKLQYARKDAEGVANFLKTQDFQVILVYDELATKTEILSRLQNDIAPNLGKNDRVLFFFAGHGYTESLGDKDFGYIVPHDGKERSATYISMEELQALSEKMGKARHQLFILDACYGGLLGTRAGFIDANTPNYIWEIAVKRSSRQYLTAGGKNQEVLDGGAGGHSFFTLYLLEALDGGLGDTNNDGYTTFNELVSYLVPRASSRYQTPAYGNLPGHGLGEFIFRSPRKIKR